MANFLKKRSIKFVVHFLCVLRMLITVVQVGITLNLKVYSFPLLRPLFKLNS